MTYLLLSAMTLSASRAILTGMCAVIVHVRVELTTTLVEIDLGQKANAKKLDGSTEGKNVDALSKSRPPESLLQGD